jgi:hypothetical protein
MVTSEEYNQLAQRCARLALACSAPSIAGALTLLALDYLAQGDRVSQQSAAQPHWTIWRRAIGSASSQPRSRSNTR